MDAADVCLEVVLEVGALGAVRAVEGALVGVGVQVAAQLPAAEEGLEAHIAHEVAAAAASTLRGGSCGGLGDGGGGGDGGDWGRGESHKAVESATRRGDTTTGPLMEAQQQRG